MRWKKNKYKEKKISRMKEKRQKMRMGTRMILLLTILMAVVKEGQAQVNKNSFMNCKMKSKLSPMDLNFPLKYSKYNLSMVLKVTSQVEWRKYESNQVSFFAEWGSITYQTLKYSIERVDVVSPSIHMISGIRYPVEVMVQAKEKYGGVLTISFLYDKYKDHEDKFLKKLKFGKRVYPKAKFASETKLPNFLKGKHDLHKLFEGNDKYLMYEGESPVGKCDPAIVFVNHNLNWISEKQYEDIVDDSLLAVTKARRIGQLVYQNIDAKLNREPMALKEEIDVPKTPSSLAFSPFVYNPVDIHSLGWIHPKYIPGWKHVNSHHVMKKVEMPRLPHRMKYLPLWHQQMKHGKKKYYKPVYVIVPRKFRWTRNIQPNTIPVYIRTNFTEPNGIRNIIKIDMPIRWNPKEKVKDKKTKKKKKKKKHKIKLKLGKKPEVFRFRRICVKWHMGVLLNRYFMNKEQWLFKDKLSGIEPGRLLQCKKWRVIRINRLGQEVNKKGKPIKNGRNGNLEKECLVYVSVILNKINHPGLRDYVSKACGKYAYIKKAPHDKPGYVVPPIPDQKPMLAVESSRVLDAVDQELEKQKKTFIHLLQ